MVLFLLFLVVLVKGYFIFGIFVGILRKVAVAPSFLGILLLSRVCTVLLLGEHDVVSLVLAAFSFRSDQHLITGFARILLFNLLEEVSSRAVNAMVRRNWAIQYILLLHVLMKMSILLRWHGFVPTYYTFLKPLVALISWRWERLSTFFIWSLAILLW